MALYKYDKWFLDMVEESKKRESEIKMEKEYARNWHVLLWMKEFGYEYTIGYVLDHWKDFEDSYNKEMSSPKRGS